MQACTAEPTVIDKPDTFPNFLCYLEPGSKVHGHVDWTVASATGYGSWLNLADDWDYNFRLLPIAETSAPQRDRGLTLNNNEVGGGNTARYIELEFASSEVADSFHSAWWQGMAKLVDPLNLAGLQQYVHPGNPNQDPVVVTVGLFGLDCEHDCRSEFHPIYALAIQLSEDPSDNEWAIFVRNWGDEGFCSGMNHELFLPGNQMSLLLPWAGAKGLSSQIEQPYPPTSLPDVGLYQDESGNGLGAKVTFTLPPPDQSGLMEALLHLHWKGGTATPPQTRTMSLEMSANLAAQQPGEQNAEHGLGDLKRRAGVTRRAFIAEAQTPPPANPVPAVRKKLKRNIYRRAAPAQRLALNAAPVQQVECGGQSNPCRPSTAKQARDLALWKKICAGLHGEYPEATYPGITAVCNDARLR